MCIVNVRCWGNIWTFAHMYMYVVGMSTSVEIVKIGRSVVNRREVMMFVACLLFDVIVAMDFITCCKHSL